jgi:hypothetical protein
LKILFTRPLENKMKLAQTNLSESENAFPLIPALSPKERENLAPSHGMAGDWIRAGGSRKIESIKSLFPLLWGEGQGEGKAREQMLWN